MRSTAVKIFCLSISIFCLAHFVSADDQHAVSASFDSPKLATLASECASSDAAEKSRRLAAFLKEIEGKVPLVEPKEGDAHNSWVTFLWLGDDKTRRVNLVGGPASTDGSSIKYLARLADTNLWYRTELVPNDARFIYIFQVNRPDVLPADPTLRSKLLSETGKDDPLNRPVAGEIASRLELPAAPAQPWLERSPGIPEGSLSDEQKIDSKALNQQRSFKVYTAPQNKPPATAGWLLIVFDGEFYSKHYPVILDNLAAQQKIPSVTAVFVHQTAERDKELHCSEPFAEFVTSELIPVVEKQQQLSFEPDHVIIAGTSVGGLMAAYCAKQHPEVFGNVLSMSGAFWWSPETNDKFSAAEEPGWLSRQYAAAPPSPTRFFLSAGRFENGYPVSLLAENRRFRDVLMAKNYSVQYREYSSGHATLCWYNPFVDGLIHLTNSSSATPKN